MITLNILHHKQVVVRIFIDTQKLRKRENFPLDPESFRVPAGRTYVLVLSVDFVRD